MLPGQSPLTTRRFVLASSVRFEKERYRHAWLVWYPGRVGDWRRLFTFHIFLIPVFHTRVVGRSSGIWCGSRCRSCARAALLPLLMLFFFLEFLF